MTTESASMSAIDSSTKTSLLAYNAAPAATPLSNAAQSRVCFRASTPRARTTNTGVGLSDMLRNPLCRCRALSDRLEFLINRPDLGCGKGMREHVDQLAILAACARRKSMASR